MRRSKGCKKGLKHMNKDYIHEKMHSRQNLQSETNTRGEAIIHLACHNLQKGYDGHGEVGCGY